MQGFYYDGYRAYTTAPVFDDVVYLMRNCAAVVIDIDGAQVAGTFISLTAEGWTFKPAQMEAVTLGWYLGDIEFAFVADYIALGGS